MRSTTRHSTHGPPSGGHARYKRARSDATWPPTARRCTPTHAASGATSSASSTMIPTARVSASLVATRSARPLCTTTRPFRFIFAPRVLLFPSAACSAIRPPVVSGRLASASHRARRSAWSRVLFSSAACNAIRPPVMSGRFALSSQRARALRAAASALSIGCLQRDPSARYERPFRFIFAPRTRASRRRVCSSHRLLAARSVRQL
jgi:hypothetical protein